MSIADWLSHPSPLYINIGFGLSFVKVIKFDFEKGLTNIKNEIDNARNIEALCPPGNPCINRDQMTV